MDDNNTEFKMSNVCSVRLAYDDVRSYRLEEIFNIEKDKYVPVLVLHCSWGTDRITHNAVDIKAELDLYHDVEDRQGFEFPFTDYTKGDK